MNILDFPTFSPTKQNVVPTFSKYITGYPLLNYFFGRSHWYNSFSTCAILSHDTQHVSPFPWSVFVADIIVHHDLLPPSLYINRNLYFHWRNPTLHHGNNLLCIFFLWMLW